MTNKHATELLGILKDEEDILRRGDLPKLGDILAAKEACREKLDRTETDPAILQRISASLTRNATLLQAAQAGVADARAVLRGLLDQDRIVTYDKDGQRQMISEKSLQLERKA